MNQRVKNLIMCFIALIAIGTGLLNGIAAADGDATHLQVILLGTGGGPGLNAQRYGISTLVVAGGEKLLFDCGRAATIRMNQLGIQASDVSKVFLTHLHSDHIISIPDLYLTPWTATNAPSRKTPFYVWGPVGTRAMMDNLQKAFTFDIHVRRDVDEKMSAEGIKVVATDIRQSVVYQQHGVNVTAFLVDHGPVKPAFGYRVDYNGHSVVMSGDTAPSNNLVKFATGVDLLIHEVGARLRNDPLFDGPPDEVLPGGTATREQLRVITAHHTDPIEAGQVFARVKPKSRCSRTAARRRRCRSSGRITQVGLKSVRT